MSGTKKIRTEKEKMLAGDLYSPIDKELINEREEAAKLLHRFNVKEVSFNAESKLILRKLMPNSAEDLIIVKPFYCDYGYNIHCGKRVFINMNCVILDVCKVMIGDHVLIGPGVHIYAATHPVDASVRRKKMLGMQVTIGNDCWIGGGAIICPGVTIGEGAVIGAGAVVTRDIPPFSVAVGNPARVIKKLR
jgi:maltose O-acetyltransferase